MLSLTLAAINDNTDIYVATTGQVLAAIVTTAGVVAVAMLTAGIPVRRRAKREREESREVQKQIHEQVANTHQTNLRDDMDGIKKSVGDVLSVLRKLVDRQDRASGDIGKIRDDVSKAADAIAALENRLTNHIDGR